VTTTAKTLPAHGTLHRRKTYKCGCTPCLARESEYARTRFRLISYGRWQPYVDAEPVRQHVRMLMSYGIGWQRVGRLAGVSNGGMSRLLYGDYSRGRGPSKRVRTFTADRIYSVQADFGNVADSAKVDSTGTSRRLRALVAQGWPQLQLAARVGLEFHAVNILVSGAGDVLAGTARTVRTVYNELWNVDPATAGVQPRYIAQAKRIAEAKAWAPPAAWDDDYIDSPAATPDLGETVDRYTAIAEDARWLIRTQGYTNAQAAHRLGITKDHLFRAFNQRPDTLKEAA
jgi:hypothetical protein